MKKKIWIPILAVVILAILFVPIPSGAYKDGGTREYTALTYKIVDWNRLTDGGGIYEKTKVYFFPYNFKSVSSLWYYEKDEIEEDVRYSFNAKILEINNNTVIVEPLPSEANAGSSDKISFDTSKLPVMEIKVGDYIKVTYTGEIMTTYPAQIDVIGWEKAKEVRSAEYTEQWVEKTDENKWTGNYELFSDIRITEIYSNCFFARTLIPFPYEIKLNGKLSDEWCVGDQVICLYENTYYDEETHKVEADFTDIKVSTFQLEEGKAYKPVIYLYPEEETEVSVKLDLNGRLTCTYPEYKDGWKVTAVPDGTLTDVNGQIYNYLYWEGETNTNYDLSKGFCVKGKDTAKFLEDALRRLGLNRKEANEFIVYWLPLMQDNPYNIISFQTDIYTDAAKLNINPSPDTLIRVFMTWQSADKYVNLPEQQLSAPERNGFTVVEWGGTEIIK